MSKDHSMVEAQRDAREGGKNLQENPVQNANGLENLAAAHL